PYPGVAVEMEWSNKDPFFDRDLLNFQALHREGALAVGVIVTRGPDLQRLIKPIILNRQRTQKYGESTTHWNKLIPRVNLGGGGECPLLLIGIQPDRIRDFGVVHEVGDQLELAAEDLRTWRGRYPSWAAARAAYAAARHQALDLLPPPGGDDEDAGQ
ncbi:MAG: BglII/BstYI family type II restriction endonuclease, partial [Anaerolineales bacterium]